jgi:acetyl-CoA acetyltransferase
MAEIAARSRKNAIGNPYAQVTGDDDPAALVKEPYVTAPLRRHDLPPISDGACAIVLATADKAKALSKRPVWIRGIDHRMDIHQPGMRDLTESPSTRIAGKKAGVNRGKIDVAELSATFSYQEKLLCEELGLGADVEVNPSGGALAANPVMAVGIARFAEAARQIAEHGKRRAVAHATSGQCLQQNLVAVLEGD